MRGWGLLAVAVLVAGCGRAAPASAKAEPSNPVASAKADPAQDLFEKLHGGAFQFDSALDSLNEAVEALRPLPKSESGETKEALLNVLDLLDSAGRVLSDHTASPAVEEVRQDAKAAEAQRMKSVSEATDALKEVREASGIVGDMLESQPPEKEKTALTKADGGLTSALDSMEEGIRLLGGTVPKEE